MSDQAFPLHEGPSGDVFPGLSKREYFAAAALTGLLAGLANNVANETEAFSKTAVHLADALIRELSKGPQE